MLGVRGKQALWEALAATQGASPVAADVTRLAERADDQRRRLEELRRRAAREALPSPEQPGSRGPTRIGSEWRWRK